MEYNLSDFQSYQDYFQAIATKHKLIDSFSFGDQDVLNNEVKVWKGRKLWLWPYGEVKTEENSNDNNLDRVPCSLFIGGAVGSAKFSNEYAYYRECEAIAKQIRNKVKLDMEEGTVLSRLTGWSYLAVEIPLATKLIGCELRFFYHNPDGFIYDETQWNS